MDLTFTEEQVMMRQSLTRFLDRHYDFERRRQILRSGRVVSEDVWTALQEMGLLALPLPEAVGGLDGSASDIVGISELLGRYLFAEPYLPTVLLCGGALARASDHGPATTWLRRIVAGDAHAGLAHEEGHGTASLATLRTTARAVDGGYVLRGNKSLVLNAPAAGILLVTARLSTGSVGMFLTEMPAEGIELSSYQTVDGRWAADVVFDDVRLPSNALLYSDESGLIQSVIDDAILAVAAEAVGAMGALLETTAQYASTREQFGAPIIAFQAIAHRIADMKIAYTKARSTLLVTTALADSGHSGTRQRCLLKAQVGRLGREVAESAVQIHGGVGTTDELVVGHHLKRILAVDSMFGQSDYHLQLLGATVD